MTAAWLLAPGTPMFFQGQEFGATSPFLYFADHVDDLARLVQKGRHGIPRPVPQHRPPRAPGLFARPGRPPRPSSRRSSTRAERIAHAEVYALHRDLLRLRREDPIFRGPAGRPIYGAVIGPEAFVLRYFGEGDDCRLVIVNLGRDLFPNPTSEPLMAPPRSRRWEILWYSEHPRLRRLRCSAARSGQPLADSGPGRDRAPSRARRRSRRRQERGPALMATVGYHASHELFPPGRLLDLARRVERAGFAAAMCSDHFHPWTERQGESGFAWSWLGAALQATGLTFGTVDAPRASVTTRRSWHRPPPRSPRCTPAGSGWPSAAASS